MEDWINFCLLAGVDTIVVNLIGKVIIKIEKVQMTLKRSRTVEPIVVCYLCKRESEMSHC